jgi:DNA/RNA non-specific endonuclease
MKQSNATLALSAVLSITAALIVTACNSNPVNTPDTTALEQTTIAIPVQAAANGGTASEPAAAQRGISAAKSLSVKGSLTLGINASGYAGRELELKSSQITANGNRIQTGTRGECKDQSGQGFCANGKALERVDLQTVLGPDVNAIAQANTPTGSTVNGSVTINTAQQLASFLAGAGAGVRINGNLTVNINAALGATNIAVNGEAKFPQGLQLDGGKVSAKEIKVNGLNLQGKSLLVVRSNLELNGANSSGETISQVIAGESIEIKSGSTGRLATVLWAGKGIEVKGSLEVSGGVLAGNEIEIAQSGALSVNVSNPLDRLAKSLGGSGSALAAFLDGADTAAIAARLGEYGPKFLRGTAANNALSADPSGAQSTGSLQAQSATDCVESIAGKSRILSAKGTVVQPGTGQYGSYSIDSEGRPYQGLKAIAKPVVATPRDGAVNTCSSAVGKLGNATDQGGHLIGLQYGGWGLRANLAPQFNTFNTYVNTGQGAVEGNWLQLEKAVTKCANLPGARVATVTVVVSFGSALTDRPSSFAMDVSFAGATTPASATPAKISGTFDNADLGGPNGTTTRTSMVNKLVAASCQ